MALQQEFPGFLQARHDRRSDAGDCQGPTAPAELHKLLTRLLDDHQRIHPHHAHLCPLCQDTASTLEQLADELPQADSTGDLFSSPNSLS